MLRVALVEVGAVQNVILVGTAYHADPGVEAIALPDDSPVGPGWTYADGQFTPPPEPEPEPNWGQFRVELAVLPSYMAIAIQMNAASPIAFQQLQIVIADTPPYVPFVIRLWNGFIDAGIQVPAEAIAEWNAIASSAHVPLVYTEDGKLTEI